MNANKRMGWASVVVTVGAVLFSFSASAQEKKAVPDFTIGNKGAIHFNVPVKAGAEVLKPGMYQLQHVVEGGEHFVAFKVVSMPAGYRHGSTRTAAEASARVKCTVAPLDKKAKRTAITLRTNASGEKEIAELLIAGESFKHVL